MDERTTHDDDFFGWSQQQAEVLRSLRDRPGLPNDLDLEHVIEEIEGVGNSQLSSVESYLRLICVHLIKSVSSTSSGPQAHWLSEIIGFHADLLSRYSRSMRQQIDLETIWRRALRIAEASLDERDEKVSGLVGTSCPFELDEFLAADLHVDALRERLQINARTDLRG